MEVSKDQCSTAKSESNMNTKAGNKKKRFQSGAEKRKKQKEKEKSAEKQRKFLAAFVVQSTSNTEESSTPLHEDKSTLHPDTEAETVNVEVRNEEEFQVENITSKIDGCNIKHLDASDDSKIIESVNVSDNFPNNIALWPHSISGAARDHYLLNRPSNVGNIKNLKVEYADRNKIYYRNISESNFYCFKANGKKEFREWLKFSETTKCIYCFVCKLFSTSNNQTKFITGYNDWKNLARSLKEHESSNFHIEAMFALKKRSVILGRIDTQLAKQLHGQQNYWREVLKRIVATMKSLSSLGIAFRGHRENVDSKRRGNFFSCIQYLSEFDSFLKNHLERYDNAGSGNVSYLSHSVCDEFIALMANEVKQHLIAEVKEAMYYSIIVDSTPDITHIDQLTFILRFVDEKGDIKERFFGFIPIESHDSAYRENVVLENLRNYSIELKNCRGQTYDNASNMSGRYTGLQARLKEHCKTATYVPCASHTLNLIGNCAAEACTPAVSYFDFIQKVYVFFSSSTRRWNFLQKNLQDSDIKNVKRISDTRWSARADAVAALILNYKEIQKSLIEIGEHANEKPVYKLEAKSLARKFDEYETALLTVIWDKLLQRINSVSKYLQDTQANLLKGSSLLKSLTEFINEVRKNFQDIEAEANLMTNNRQYKERRKRKRKYHFDENKGGEACHEEKQSFIINVHNVICDILIAELTQRSTTYNNILNDFQIFFDGKLEEKAFETCVTNLITKYADDIEAHYFKDEVKHFIKYTKNEKVTNPMHMYKLIKDGLQSTFPNVETILKIFLTLPICNASGERSFSVLKRVKNYLRNSMSQPHLNELSLLFIENDVVQELDYEKMIDKFSKLKARKVTF
ncbi:Zinc finger MYM-type protein 1 [Araneus ventricosus]|uniref:Zinc finger MYM-type protein 1 n=1 Tax=Araneus ventricosus TaxID=182803 RepID=A0A4Y2R2I1_ARAVE|nr:Zinc finger MYM-type protein 1 [Araneus ventricosus]GBN69620.1 Zinc finger MYM-type protein 1 [Araneus ventricosus]